MHSSNVPPLFRTCLERRSSIYTNSHSCCVQLLCVVLDFLWCCTGSIQQHLASQLYNTQNTNSANDANIVLPRQLLMFQLYRFRAGDIPEERKKNTEQLILFQQEINTIHKKKPYLLQRIKKKESYSFGKRSISLPCWMMNISFIVNDGQRAAGCGAFIELYIRTCFVCIHINNKQEVK